MTGQRTPMSQATYDKLSKQLENMKKVDRPRIIQEIADARSQGDLAENAEYHAAKERQGQIEDSIAQTEDKLARAEIITVSAADADHIIFGATVKVLNLDTQKEVTYTLIGPDGVNLLENKISSKSPIGKTLMGKKVDDEVSVVTPKGTLNFKILSFS